ncbi:unnamed protein product [Lampetra planeri]
MADPLARSCDRERINSFGAERRRSSIVVLFVLVDRGGWFVAQLSTRCAVVVGHGAPGYSLKAESTFAHHSPPPLSAPGRESEIRITPGSQRVRRASRCCCRRSARFLVGRCERVSDGGDASPDDANLRGLFGTAAETATWTFVTRCARVLAVSSSAAPSSGRLLRNRTREIPGTAYERCAEKRRRLGDGFPWEALRRAELTTQRGSGRPCQSEARDVDEAFAARVVLAKELRVHARRAGSAIANSYAKPFAGGRAGGRGRPG